MEFLREHADLTQVIDASLLVAHALAFGVVSEHKSKSMVTTYAALMWQVACDYHRQSLTHILARELDSAFALLRMAIELARDFYVIGKDEQLLELWMSREESVDIASKYRKKFKFDLSNPSGKISFDLYKLCSRYGVHGHMTSLMHANRTGKADSDVVLLDTDVRAIFGGLQIWLRAYFPIHALFCDAFQLNENPEWEPYRLFLELIASLEPILDAVDNVVGRKPELV